MRNPGFFKFLSTANKAETFVGCGGAGLGVEDEVVQAACVGFEHELAEDGAADFLLTTLFQHGHAADVAVG